MKDRLLEGAKRMDPGILSEIHEMYYKPLYNYALRLVHDPLTADNIVGNVFANLIDQWATGRGPETNLRSYLYETTYHEVVDEAKDRQFQAPLELVSNTPLQGHSTQALVELSMQKELLMAAINSDLTEDQKQIVNLRFFGGLNLEETAAALGKSVDSVKVGQNRAVVRLRTALGIREASGLLIDEEENTTSFEEILTNRHLIYSEYASLVEENGEAVYWDTEAIYKPKLESFAIKMTGSAEASEEASAMAMSQLRYGKKPDDVNYTLRESLHAFTYSELLQLSPAREFSYNITPEDAAAIVNSRAYNTSGKGWHGAGLDAFAEAFNTFFPKSRAGDLLVLRLVEGFSIKQSANIIRISKANARVIQNRALTNIKEIVEAHL